jgi:hypothetical protein
MLHSVVERLVVEGDGDEAGTHELSTYLLTGDRGERIEGVNAIAHPDGWRRLVWFEKSAAACEWCWRVGRIEVRKRMVLSREMRGVTVRYSVEGAGVTRGGGRGDAEKSGRGAVRLRLVLRPLAAMRDFHGLLREGGGGVRLAVPEKTAGNADTGARGRGDAGVRVGSEGAALTLALGNEASAGVKSKFRRDEQWWRGFFYPREAERGQDCVEDLFSPGEFVWEMGKGMSRGAVTLNAAVDGEACDVSREEERQKSRLERLVRWTVGRAAKGGEVQEGIKAGGIEASRRNQRGGSGGGTSASAASRSRTWPAGVQFVMPWRQTSVSRETVPALAMSAIWALVKGPVCLPA